MFDHVDNSITLAPGQKKQTIYFVAHNGSGFDSYVLQNDDFLK